MKEKRAEKATPGKACKQGLRQWGLTDPTLVEHGSYFRGARVLHSWGTGPTSVNGWFCYRRRQVLLRFGFARRFVAVSAPISQ